LAAAVLVTKQAAAEKAAADRHAEVLARLAAIEESLLRR
jgi:hypothetical protein